MTRRIVEGVQRMLLDVGSDLTDKHQRHASGRGGVHDSRIPIRLMVRPTENGFFDDD
jgi:hypothetical protein